MKQADYIGLMRYNDYVRGAYMGADVESEPDLFKGLSELAAGSFPKTCSSCGRVYQNIEQFLAETEAVGEKSGLKSSMDEDDATIVEIFRNCSCGSTLLEFSKDRRDTSPQGLERRERFGHLLTTLVKRGLDEQVAKQELLKVVRGQQSELLQALLKQET